MAQQPGNHKIAIRVENLHKVFYSVQGFWRRTRKPVTAVEDISFAVPRGQLFGMVGPNGAGKTTTVKMLSTLLLPTSGTARIFGFDIRDTAIIRARIGELLEIVGLTGRENDRVETYSNGMQQRLHLARALLHDPQLIFLDEPPVGIDPIGAREIRQLIKGLVERGKTVLLTSHYMYEVEELCDRIAIVNHGCIIALDTPAALKARS